ncbi:MAG: ABC transporter permease [Acidobacteria bacterium]|nr:ABC transporter permease [Acidobacteriota bacterium]
MTRILQVALRDFLAVVATKGFLFGLVTMPAVAGIMVVVGPRLFDDGDYRIVGEYAVVDPTGDVAARMRAAVEPEAVARRRLAGVRRAMGQVPEAVRRVAPDAVPQSLAAAAGPVPEVSLTLLPADTDLDAAREWLQGNADGPDEPRRVALIVIHDDAVRGGEPDGALGTYDLYVHPGLDDRDIDFCHEVVREAIVDARAAAHGIDRSAIDRLLDVPRQSSVTVGAGADGETVGGLNRFLPMAYMMLLFIGIMVGGQNMLASTVEEKSNRVVEVLLSAVSPMELMAGKLLGAVAVSLVMMAFYVGIGLALLASFSLLGLIDPWLILYLVIFFLLGFLVIGSLMLAAGAAVNDMNEAASLQAPLMVVIMVPWLVSPAVARSPESTLAYVVSFAPPINTFGMLIRMASTQPPPWWQVWLSIAVGAASVVGAVWIAAKVFRIGLLMYGKPPDLRTLMRWVRAA